MRATDELKETIVLTAKKMILEHGILNTDMKDIAKEVGCSRSTLYRHFPSKGDILVVLADEALGVLRQAQIIPANYRFANGFEAFSWQMQSMLDAAVRNVDSIMFLRDFDCLFYEQYGDTNTNATFTEKTKHSSEKSPLQESYNRGIADGSIRPAKDRELFVLMVFQTFIATLERVLPLEEAYVTSYGYGQEILREYVNTITLSIKA